MAYAEIDVRYSKLANDTCCLSCGDALDFSKPLPGETCVDLGSGRGTDVMRMAEQVGEEGFVYGIDISEGMINKALRTAEKLSITNVNFIKTELEKIPINSRSVDLVISNCTINHARDKQRVWNEIERILKKGGRFVVSDIYSVNNVPEQYRNDPEAIAECWAGAVTRSEYLNQMQKAGLVEIEILEESTPYKKGKIKVSSFTVKGKVGNCCCSNQ